MEPNTKRFALGKRTPSNRLSLNFGEFVTVMPSAPLVDLAPDFVYPMDGNDSVGDCVVAGWDHFRQVVTGLLTGTQKNFTQAEIWDFYKTQNQNFDPNGTSQTNGAGSSSDRGMDIQVFLEYLVSKKLILGFAKIDYTNDAELRAAVYIGLGIITGVVIRNAQMGDQFNKALWDFVPTSPVEGGHCVPFAGYNDAPKVTACITWAKLVQCTDAFILNQMDEAWFVLMQEHVDHPSFRNHFDLAGFSKAVSAITGGKVVIPVNPTLRIGSKGSPVVTLQNKLNQNGANLVADGNFGVKTQTALIAFQKWHGLAPDGVCGKMTWQAFDMVDIVTSIANANSIDPLLLLAICSCESGFNPLAKLFNPPTASVPSGSTDRGLFQWNDHYHKEISDVQAYDPTIATQKACQSINASHANIRGNWSASQPCWIKKLTPEIINKYGLN